MRMALVVLAIVLPLTLAALLPDTLLPLPLEQRLAAAVFVTTISLWLFEAIPLPATALLVPTLISLYGLQPIDEAIAPFGSSVLFLFLGAFLLSQAMHKHKLDARIAYTILRAPGVAASFHRIAAALFGTAFVLSMWVSNTATAALMYPIVLGVAGVLAADTSGEHSRRIQSFLLLGIAYSCSIGGIATPIGSPPNVITLGFLKTEGLQIGFLAWMTFATPLAVSIAVVMFFVLRALFQTKSFPDLEPRRLRRYIDAELQKLGLLRRPELITMAAFFTAVFLWLLPGVMQQLFPTHPAANWLNTHLSMTAVALLAGVSLFALPSGHDDRSRVLEWTDAQAVDWGTIILFGGGLSLGAMLESSGLASVLGSSLFGRFEHSIWLAPVAIGSAILLTEVASNTASVTILVALLLGALPSGSAIGDYATVIGVALATSCSFMLPVATPPNAIIYGSGAIRLKEMLRAGIFLNLIAWLFICVTAGLLSRT